MELFWDIGIRLAVILENGLTISHYIYVDDTYVSTLVARYHFHLLMVLYPQHLNLIAIRGYFAYIPHDITLINEEDL